MLVIHRSHGGMGRYYRGSGMLDEIGQKLFSNGIKNDVISSGTSSTIAHKVADAVVNGAANAIIKEAVSAGVGKAVNTVVDSVVNTVKKKKKRSHPSSSHAEGEPLKRTKIDIDSLIDGSGIVYD